jgi:hypothetical protein
MVPGWGWTSLSADSFRLEAEGLPHNASVLFFQALSPAGGGQGAHFGDGLRCAGGGKVRLSIRTALDGRAHVPGPGEPPLSERGQIPPEGGSRVYQAWYRDPHPSFCTPATFNLSNGWSTSWSP